MSCSVYLFFFPMELEDGYIWMRERERRWDYPTQYLSELWIFRPRFLVVSLWLISEIPNSTLSRNWISADQPDPGVGFVLENAAHWLNATRKTWANHKWRLGSLSNQIYPKWACDAILKSSWFGKLFVSITVGWWLRDTYIARGESVFLFSFFMLLLEMFTKRISLIVTTVLMGEYMNEKYYIFE